MRPVRQGAFDALCGLYAVVNAVEVVGLKGPRSSFHKRLFDRLVVGLDHDDVKFAVTDGLGPDELIGAARKAFRWVDRTYGVKLSIRRPRHAGLVSDADEFLDWFDRATDDGRHAVIVNVVMPWLDHWTVAARRDGRRLIVRDSHGLQTLDLGRFTLGGGAYRLRADHTLLIARRDDADAVDLSSLRPNWSGQL